MQDEERLRLIKKDVTEIITDGELEKLIFEKKNPKGYIGFEPSGLMHVGQAINALKIVEMTRAGMDFTIFMADWHAKINDKLDGDIDKIRICGEYMKHCFLGFEVDPDKTKFVYASDIVDKAKYWETFVHISKASSLSRIKRAMTIMGRDEDDAEMDFSKLVYPPMQVADIFELEVDIAYGGLDQRHAHMLARDVAEKLGWKKPIAMHSWLLPSLTGSGRMDATQNKMSKSDPKTSIIVNDSPESISEKISKAFCPPNDVEDNPVLAIAERLIFPANGRFSLLRSEKFGGDLDFSEFESLRDAYSSGKIHPKDLKENMARELADMLAPVRKHFEKNPKPLEGIMRLLAGRNQ
ncbi:MAG: tyrosine--tRNA ligase [Thermoplasmata archaeon]|nr:tyrosine--tRNA ligase [Thermoplasmata archaeon]